MKTGELQGLRIDPSQRRRPKTAFRVIVAGVAVVTVAAAFLAWPRKDERRVMKNTQGGAAATPAPSPVAATVPPSASNPAQSAPAGNDVVLTVSGYIVNRERIELSPRFMGVVKWIGVKKGDAVKKDQVVVLLDDAEQQARLKEAGGTVESAKARVSKAELDFNRAKMLQTVDAKKSIDDARIEVDSANAVLQQAEGGLAYARTLLDWTVIRSPIDGVVLEKLVDPAELVSPQSFGGTRGPSTAFLALADPNDLQVEIDVSEGDIAKVSLDQKCRVTPEAYSDKNYEGYVAEIAPEADRSKGTLQVKVQIRNPDQFLTPELSAKVEFLRDAGAQAGR